jgi:hypothetical protein
MREPTLALPTAATLALAPVPSLGVVLAGCAACRLPLGLDGAEGLDAALAGHLQACPQVPEVCPRCHCEGALQHRMSGWRCGDCLGELVLDDLGTAATLAPARPAQRLRAVPVPMVAGPSADLDPCEEVA